MTVSNRGFVATGCINGNGDTNQNIFVLKNGFASRVDVCVRRLNVQCDGIAALTTVMPIVKCSRATSVSGGSALPTHRADSAQANDACVVALSGDNAISATPGDTIWQQFTNRMHSVIEQVTSWDNNILPALVDSTPFDIVLHPGESLLVRIVGATSTSNPFVGMNWFVEAVWEEQPLPTFAISGTVTLSGSPVSGARVIVLEADDETLTNAWLSEVIVTGAGGTWTSQIRTGKVGAAFVQYKSGATYYTAPGSPFLQ